MGDFISGLKLHAFVYKSIMFLYSNTPLSPLSKSKSNKQVSQTLHAKIFALSIRKCGCYIFVNWSKALEAADFHPGQSIRGGFDSKSPERGSFSSDQPSLTLKCSPIDLKHTHRSTLLLRLLSSQVCFRGLAPHAKL